MAIDISADDLRARIQEALLDEFYGGEASEAGADDLTRDAANSIWVCDLFPMSQTFVYSGAEGDKYRRGYSISAAGMVSLSPDKTEVQRAKTNFTDHARGAERYPQKAPRPYRNVGRGCQF